MLLLDLFESDRSRNHFEWDTPLLVTIRNQIAGVDKPRRHRTMPGDVHEPFGVFHVDFLTTPTKRSLHASEHAVHLLAVLRHMEGIGFFHETHHSPCDSAVMSWIEAESLRHHVFVTPSRRVECVEEERNVHARLEELLHRKRCSVPMIGMNVDRRVTEYKVGGRNSINQVVEIGLHLIRQLEFAVGLVEIQDVPEAEHIGNLSHLKLSNFIIILLNTCAFLDITCSDDDIDFVSSGGQLVKQSGSPMFIVGMSADEQDILGLVFHFTLQNMMLDSPTSENILYHETNEL
jgi:hypothetical protein